MVAETKRRFCRVFLEDKHTESKPILLTVVGPTPVILTNDGQFMKMLDVKEGKEHFFNVDRVVRIQLEDERE